MEESVQQCSKCCSNNGRRSLFQPYTHHQPADCDDGSKQSNKTCTSKWKRNRASKPAMVTPVLLGATATAVASCSKPPRPESKPKSGAAPNTRPLLWMSKHRCNSAIWFWTTSHWRGARPSWQVDDCTFGARAIWTKPMSWHPRHRVRLLPVGSTQQRRCWRRPNSLRRFPN